jgi:hypothetical protein
VILVWTARPSEICFFPLTIPITTCRRAHQGKLVPTAAQAIWRR